MNLRLLFFLCTSVVFSYASESCLSVGYYSDANKKIQEDRFSIDSIRGAGKDFFGVYDGHCGSKVAEYLKNNLAISFAASLKTSATKKEAFASAFKHIEKHVLENMFDGSTAVAVYVENNKAHIAWVGDSRAVLANSDNKIVFATSDHNFKRKDEIARVQSAGGILLREKIENGATGDWRINRLEMSRSIGDPGPKGFLQTTEHTTFNPVSRIVQHDTKIVWQQWPGENLLQSITVLPLPGQVIAEPEYAEISLNEEGRWLIIASDGLWDTINAESAVSFVTDLSRQCCPLKSIAESLVRTALNRGTHDNVTVLLIDLLNR